MGAVVAVMASAAEGPDTDPPTMQDGARDTGMDLMTTTETRGPLEVRAAGVPEAVSPAVLLRRSSS